MTRWNHDRAECPPDPSEQYDGPRTVQNFAAELQASLPARWTVEEYVLMDPKKMNHGGAAVIESARATHPDGVTLRVEGIDASSSLAGPTLYNGHRISEEIDDDRHGREIVAEGGRDRVRTIRGVHEILTERADEHASRRQWFHTDKGGTTA